MAIGSRRRNRCGRAGRSSPCERDELLHRQSGSRRGLRQGDPLGARRRRGGGPRRRCGRDRVDLARGARPCGPVHRHGDRPASGRGRRDRRRPRERPRADERADAGKPARSRGAGAGIPFGASRFRWSGASLHRHDDDRRDAGAGRSLDAGAARHRMELARGAHLPVRHRRAKGALSPAAREGRDHGRGRDDRAAGGLRRRAPRDDRDATPGRLLDPSGSQAVHLRGAGRHGDRARAVGRGLERARRSRHVHRRPRRRQLRRRARRAQVRDPCVADLRTALRRNARDSAR